jgi:DNA (cytosine-5)-methyltransferase 1
VNYYNEFDHKAAAWLRELIRAGLIPDGHVDTRSIVDVQPSDLTGYAQCHFFAGIGGWSLALQLAGWPADRPVWTGSCPCQPFSSAGKQLGAADERHLWPAFFNLIRQCRPVTVFGEQVANAIGKGWLDGVSADLEQEGYACGAAVLGAHSVGAPHIRQRLYWVANAQYNRLNRENGDAPEQGGNRPDNGLLVGGGGELCESGRLAITKGQGRPGMEPELQAGIGQRSWAGGDSPVGGLAHTNSKQDLAPNTGGLHAEPASGGTAGGLVNAFQSRLEGLPGYGDHRDQPGRLDQEPDGPATTASGSGHWSAHDLLHCTDGKTRRIEPGSFPLAHGVPGRVGLLRGYGNAIVPQVAAAFIEAACVNP